MATIITEECINCGACEPECPNTAIYQGAVEYEFNGATHAAIDDDIFYIVPEKCTECVGFFDQEACAAVCPVDCCLPNPDIVETETALLARAKELHPEDAFADDFPSRFKGEGTAAPAAADAAVKHYTGARCLRYVVEEALLEVMYELPSRNDVVKCVVDADSINGICSPTLITGSGDSFRISEASFQKSA